MTDIGPGRRTPVRSGSRHVMTGSCSSRVIGKAISAGLNMTLDGTATAIGITATTTMTTAVTADVKTATEGRPDEGRPFDSASGAQAAGEPYHRTCAPRPTMRPLRIPDGWLYVAGAVALAIE